jgi:hypothetical protein
MIDSLAQLEAKRTDLFRQLASVGNFRRCSVTATSGKWENRIATAPNATTRAMAPTSD